MSDFDYFKPIAIQSHITDEFDEVIPASPAPGDRGVVKFFIPGNATQYRDLARSQVVIKLKVKNTDNTDLANDAAVAPENNFLHNLFSSVDVSLCSTPMNEKSTLYPYRAFLETLLTYGKDVTAARSSLAGWELDTCPIGDIDKTILADAGGNAANPAHVKRQRLIASSRTLTLIGRLHHDLFHNELDIPPECPVLVTLTPSEDKFCLHGGAATFAVKLISAELHVRTRAVKPELLLAHRRMLQETNMRFAYDRVHVQSIAVNAGLTEFSVSNVFPEKMPKRIVCGLVTQARTAGAFGSNPFVFGNHSVQSFSVTVDGASVPRTAWETNYADGDYAEAYISTLAALDLDVGDNANSLTPELFKAHYALYAFKLVPGPVDKGPMLYAGHSTGSVNIKIKFRAAPAAPLDLIIYSETPSMFEITKMNSVLKL